MWGIRGHSGTAGVYLSLFQATFRTSYFREQDFSDKEWEETRLQCDRFLLSNGVPDVIFIIRN
jgi:hypothetical protein